MGGGVVNKVADQTELLGEARVLWTRILTNQGCVRVRLGNHEYALLCGT